MPSTSEASFTPVTVTVGALSQLPLVKVSVAGETVASPVSPLTMVSTTSVAGCVSSTSVKVSVLPDSFTEIPPLSVTVIAGTGAGRSAKV